MKRTLAILAILTLGVTAPALAQSAKRSEVQRQIVDLRSQINRLEQQLLAPSDDDYAAFPSYRDQLDRGLFRLLPRERFDKSDVMTIRGGGAYYSFTRFTHEYGYGSDIELSHGTLSVGFAGADYGLLVAVPGVTLDTLGVDHPAAREVISHVVPATEPEVRQQQRRTGEGYAVGGFAYGRRVGAKVGMVYILRSISFEQSDVVVALQPLREDEDGSFVFAWRMLQKNPTPTFVRRSE